MSLLRAEAAAREHPDEWTSGVQRLLYVGQRQLASWMFAFHPACSFIDRQLEALSAPEEHGMHVGVPLRLLTRNHFTATLPQLTV